MSYTKKRSNSILNIPKFPWGGLDNLIKGMQRTYPENEDEDEDEDGKEAKNIRNAFSLFGSIASPLLGIGGAMLNKAMANSNMMANDYYTYQNEMENSKGSINRGGLTSILKYGGRIMRFPDGGEMPEDQGPKLIQAEKGETIIDGMGNIFDVKANKLHKDMSKNDVTDVLTPNQYVLSNRFELSKKDADKIPIGISQVTYNEKTNKGGVKEKYLGDLFKKDKHTLAELSKILRDKYPTMFEEQDGNIFARNASNKNRETRMNFLAELIQMNEEKKQKKENNQQMSMNGMAKYGGVPLFDEGGSVNSLPKISGTLLNLNKILALGKYASNNKSQITDGPKNSLPSIPGTPFNLNQMLALGKYASNNKSQITYNPFGNTSDISAIKPQIPWPNFNIEVSTETTPDNKTIVTDEFGNKKIVTQEPFDLDSIKDNVDMSKQNAHNLNGVKKQKVGDGSAEEESKYMKMINDQIQKDLNDIEPRYQKGLKGARSLFFQNLTGNAMGTLAGMFGVLSQDAFSEAPKVARVNTPRSVGRGYYDYLNWNNNKALRSAVSAALENTGDYGRAMSYIGNALGQTVNANNQVAAQSMQQNLGLENAYQQALSASRTQQSQFDVGAREQMRSAANSNAANIASLNINKINQDTAINNRYFDYISKLNLDKNLQKQQLYNNLIQMELMKKYFK